MTPVFERKVKPADCGLAFGLPLDRDEFESGLLETSSKDWAKFFSASHPEALPNALWTEFYVPEIVEPAMAIIGIAERLNVTIYRACTLADLSYAADRHAVLTLVSHWVEDGAGGIELSDDLHPVEKVAAALPTGYNRLLDLMICQSILLADAVKRRYPDCACLCNSKPVRPRRKLYLYGQTLLAIEPGKLAYADAVFSTYREHLKGSKK
jgi:hypothetical protein